MATKIESIRYTINADGIRSMELGSLSLDEVLGGYRSRLESSLTAAYPGAEIEVEVSPIHIRSESQIEVDGDTDSMERDAIRALADAALEAVFDEAASA